MGVPKYRTKFSKKTFTQHQHLLGLALKELKKTSYRGLVDELADSKAVDARAVKRDIKNVSEDVRILSELGLIEVEVAGPGKPNRISLSGDQIDLHLIEQASG